MNIFSRPSLSCIILLLVGATLRIDINLFGRLALGEILLICSIPLFWGDISRMVRQPLFQRMALLLILWLIGVIISDVMNESEFEFFARGLARPVLCLLMLLPLFHFGSTELRSFNFFFVGLAIGGVLNVIMPTDFRVEAYQEYEMQMGADDMGYGLRSSLYTPAAYGVASIGGFLLFRISPFFSGVFFLVIAAIVAPILSRTSASVFLVAGILIIAVGAFPRAFRYFRSGAKLKPWPVSVAIMGGLICSIAVYYLWADLASKQLIGMSNYYKFQTQTNTVFGNTPWGALMSGRHFTFAAILRIMDYPLYGAGSWPFAGDTVVRTLEMLGGDVDLNKFNPQMRDIGHSILFGIWAQNGPLVVPFLIYSYYVFTKLMFHIILSKSPIKALSLPYFLMFAFGFFFNNFNSLARVFLVMLPILYHFMIQAARMTADRNTLAVKKSLARRRRNLSLLHAR